MSEEVLNPETKENVQVTNTVEGGEGGQDQTGAGDSHSSTPQVSQLTTLDVQNLIAEALAAFKSELLMKDVDDSEEGDFEEEQPKKERSL